MPAISIPCPRCGGSGVIRDDREVGAENRRAREQKGITLRAMAHRMGISVQYLSDLELGRRRWNDQQSQLFASCLAIGS